VLDEGQLSAAPIAPWWGELRYGGELVRLLASRDLLDAGARSDAPPVVLIPGFMAGDASLAMMRYWLRRRGHPVASSGIIANVDCAERTVSRLQPQLARLASEHDAPVVVIGQSRGGAIARVLAVREPDSVGALVMLGTPVREPLAVADAVMRTVRWVARLGDLGLPGVCSTSCREGECCADFREHLLAPIPARVRAVAVHSRTDAIVDWRACVDPYAQTVEIDSSHCGMSVHPAVYRALEQLLDTSRHVTPSLPS
jgi:pimeloyl-ACP methyl ester carboxylesterase